MRPAPEAVQVVKSRRDAALSRLVEAMPYARFLRIGFDRRGDELTAVLPFREDLIGNPGPPALHGGVTASFLEVAALVQLAWAQGWDGMEAGLAAPDAPLRLPKTINFAVDYLRTGLPRDAYARAQVTRSGRRYASVHAEAWQDNRERPFAQASGHFLMPDPGTSRDGTA